MPLYEDIVGANAMDLTSKENLLLFGGLALAAYAYFGKPKKSMKTPLLAAGGGAAAIGAYLKSKQPGGLLAGADATMTSLATKENAMLAAGAGLAAYAYFGHPKKAQKTPMLVGGAALAGTGLYLKNKGA